MCSRAEIIRAKLKQFNANKPKRVRAAPASPTVLPAMVVQKAPRTTSNVTLAEASLSSALVRRQMASLPKRPTAELARSD